MEPITSFEDWVRQRRKELDLTQAQLAERTGYALVTIRKIEQAMRRPSRQMAELLAEALAIPEAQRDAFLRLARHQYVDPRAMPSIAGETLPAFSTESLGVLDEVAESNNFVGRKREMAQLEAHLTSALNGSGRIVFIAGEAGYGKTTLMAEFAQHALTIYPDLILASGDCEAYAGAGNPYLPFRDVMAMLTCDVETPGRARPFSQEQTRRLWALLPHSTQVLVNHGPDLIDVFVSGARLRQRVLAHPIAADTCQAQIEALTQQQTRPEEVPQRKLFEQFAQMLRSLAKRQPLLLLLDDLQWIDHASADLLFYLATRLTGSRIMLLGTYRRSEVESQMLSVRATAEEPEVHALTPLLLELKRHYGDIEIDLGQSTAQMDRAFVDALLDCEPNHLPEIFRSELFQRTRGHPLFTVELLLHMQERGDLVQDSQRGWIEGGAVDWEELPARVEAVISQRIGRLPTILQEGLKIASVEGETFTAEVIAAILGVDGWEMVQQLSGIVGKQHRLVIGQGAQRLGNQLLSRYRFVHILFQTYLYGSLDTAERAYLHEAVGYALEQLSAEQTEAVAVQLAHHFQAAGLTEKAIDYLHQAGRQAVALSAHREAITHLTRALALNADLPETYERARRELQLQTDLGVSYKITKGFAAPEVERVYRRAQILCDPVRDTLSWACVMWGLVSVYTVRGDLAPAHRTAQEFLGMAQDDPVQRVTGHCMLGCTLIHMGRLNSARTHFEQARDAYSTQQHGTHIFLSGLDLGVFTLAHLAHTLCYLGYPNQALEVGQEAVKLAQALSHPFSHASALSYLTMLYQLHGDWRTVQDTVEITNRLCVEHDIPYYLAWTNFMQGWAMAQQDSVGQGIPQMEQSLTDLQSMQTGLRRPYYLCVLAETYGKVGRIEDGLRLLADALAQANEQEQNLYEPEVHRVRGELLRKQEAADDRVESCFRRAIEVAQQQEAKLMELRAATSLARLHQSQGKYVDARRTLAGVVDWFSEGFELADLQKARGLLVALT